MTQLNLAARPCGECLTTRNRIVTKDRAREIIAECLQTGTHFFCHKSCAARPHVHCAGVHALHTSVSYALARAVGVPVVLHDMDAPVEGVEA